MTPVTEAPASTESMALAPAAANYQKQQVNVYTVMLIIAFLSISIGCLLLYMELQRWGTYPWWKTVGTGIANYLPGLLSLTSF